MSTAGAICSKCIYRRTRPKSQLFNLSEMQMSEVLKRENERQQQDEARRQQEEQRVAARGSFNYEPYYYDWCDIFTPFDASLFEVLFDAEGRRRAIAMSDRENVRKLAKESNHRGKDWIRKAHEGNTVVLDDLAEHASAMMNPVSGEVMQIYALCAWMNPDGGCPLFDPRS